jgi:hypothetical protein
MKSSTAMRELEHADPVPRSADVPEISVILAQVGGSPARVRPVRRLRHRWLASGGALAMVVAAGVLVFLGGGKQGVDVVAAAYAATSPRGAASEAVFQTTAGTRTFRQQVWADPALHSSRELIRSSDGASTVEIDRSIHGGWMETWFSDNHPREVQRERTSLGAVQGSWLFEGLQLGGLGGVTLMRDLLRAGRIHVAGRSSTGQWRLESPPTMFDGNRARLTVVVDAHSFLPQTQTLVDLGPKDTTTVRVRSKLVSYRRIPAHGLAATVFSVAHQHPKSRVVTRSGTFPKFQRFEQAARRKK